MSLVDLDALPDADEVWWRFAVASAVGISQGDDSFTHDPTNQVLTYNNGATFIAMQRLYRGRVVLWGRSDTSTPHGEWSGLPGWATSDAVYDSLERIGVTFVLWHARDGWESTAAVENIDDALAILVNNTIDPSTMATLRDGSAEDSTLVGLGAGDLAAARALLKNASGEAPAVQGTVRRLLALEIEEQMRRTPDRDRLLPQRPVPLVRWSTIAKPPGGFTYAVRASAEGLVRTNDFVPRLAVESLTSLHNVLTELYLDEANTTSGGWLFARVRFNGVQVHLDRAFDGQPVWSAHAPSLEYLAHEMEHRDASWRPTWALLLPPSNS